MGKAKFVKTLYQSKGAIKVELFEVGPEEYIVVSAFSCVRSHEGRPETFIFASDKEGDVTDWTPLPGSFSGAMDIDKALRDGRWEVQRDTREEGSTAEE